ncbi:unnamed protein product [Lymnaea stagnalis]|uniref:Uncharacterized protein n=1 Tax=Lymnaea stagnalis TaxID=6523 RepID=A0AAV2HQ27_LYMST
MGNKQINGKEKATDRNEEKAETEYYIINEVCEFIELESDDTKDAQISEEKSCSCKDPNTTNSFIGIDELTLDKLPDDIRHESLLTYILSAEKLVTHILVRCQPDPETDNEIKKGKVSGTGYLWLAEDEVEVYDQCPLVGCPHEQPHQSYGGIIAYTNHHVVRSQVEAMGCNVRIFFNSGSCGLIYSETIDDCIKPILVYGYRLREHRENKDLVGLQIIFHDAKLFDLVKSLSTARINAWSKVPDTIKEKLKKHAIVISHPHGKHKVISFGELLNFEELINGDKVTEYTASTCQGSSGAPVLTGHYSYRPFTHRGKLGKVRKGNQKVNVSYSF